MGNTNIPMATFFLLLFVIVGSAKQLPKSNSVE